MEELKKGKKLSLLNGDTVIIQSKLGEGGQGSVYSVGYNGKKFALKWYLPNYLRGLKPDCGRFYKNLVRNVEDGAPSPCFLWMQAVAVTGKHSKGFGYIMDLRPAGYYEFTRFIKAREKFASTDAVIRAAINVVEAFQALHRSGKSYQDLSPGNFFIDKVTGDVLICDNDNVAPNGTGLGVGGTPGYMAPEVILGKSAPNTDTDLFSLAVILFELFFLSHPLEGANCCRHPCLTPQIEKELYAVNPVFVCSKEDTSNAPVRGTCSNLMRLWPLYPEFVHDYFRRAFSKDALHDGAKRLSEKDWKEMLYVLQDSAVHCSHCGEMNFAVKEGQKDLKCAGCGRMLVVPYSLSINGFRIAVEKGKMLTEYHLSRGDRRKAVGEVAESKKTAGVFGLKNLSPDLWTVRYPGKEEMYYANGKTVTLIPGTEIQIGAKTMRVIQ